jgi:hypothetical protein
MHTTEMSYSLVTSVGLLVFALILSFLFVRYESFIGSPDVQRCGVDTAPCPFGTVCMNGYCQDSTPPPLPKDTGLPVYP